MKNIIQQIVNIGIMVILVILASNYAFAFGFNFEVFGYTISYIQPAQQEIISEVDNMPRATHEFDETINFINTIKETQMILKELSYNNLAFTDTDTNKGYTIIISDEGLITGVYEGYLNPEEYFSGSISTIKAYAESQSYMAIKQEINVPFRVKLKLLSYNIFGG